MQQKVGPGVIAAAIVVLVVFISWWGWKNLSKSGSGGNTNPYSNYKGPVPGSGGGSHGPMGSPSGSPSGSPGSGSPSSSPGSGSPP